MYQNLTPEEWQAQVSKDSNALIIDVRTVGEFQQSPTECRAHARYLKKNYKILINYYLHCRVGGRSAIASYLLQSKWQS